jgi:hypothetical protein
VAREEEERERRDILKDERVNNFNQIENENLELMYKESQGSKCQATHRGDPDNDEGLVRKEEEADCGSRCLIT